MAQNDKYYVERCLNGYPDDFRHLIQRYQNVLLAYLLGKLRNKDNAEEGAQETFVRAFFNMNKLRTPESFFRWVLGIANRVAKEQQRNELIRLQRETIHSLYVQAPQAEFSQNYGLEAAIAQLPPSYREVVLLRYYGSYSCRQIADQFDMPLGTVTKKLSRAYALLRRSLQQEQDEQINEV